MDSVVNAEGTVEAGQPLVILMNPGGTCENSTMNTCAASHVMVPQMDSEAVGPVVTFIEENESLPELQATLSLVDQEQVLAEHDLADHVLDNQGLSEQSLMVTTAEEEALSSLLNSVPFNSDSITSEQRLALFQADDGQIVCLSYTMAEGEENGAEVDIACSRGSGVVGPAEDQIQIVDDISAFSCSSISSDVLFVEEDSSTLMSDEVLSKLRLEDRLRVLEQLLPPVPRVRPLSESKTVHTPPVRSSKASTSAAKTLHEALPGSDPAPASSVKTPPPRPPPPRLAPAPVRPKDPGGGGGGHGKRPTQTVSVPGALYACDLCGACFERPAQFYGHLHRHSGERKYKCSHCAIIDGASVREFDSAAALRAHERSHHPMRRPHCCSLCGERFDRASQLDYHTRRVHGGERPHRCLLCSKAFFKRSDLRTHLNVHLGIHSCVCETCGRRFGHVSNLIRHARTHAGSRPYPCPVCGRRFAQINAVVQHRTAAHPEYKDVYASETPPCGEENDRNSGIGQGVPCGSRVPCAVPDCTRTFRTVNVMRKHARTTHGVFLPTVAQQQRMALQDSFRCESGVLAPVPSAHRKRRFHCAACGAQFGQAALLREHERAHEVAAGAAGLPCSGCALRCATVEDLRTHACLPPPERRSSPCRLPLHADARATTTTTLEEQELALKDVMEAEERLDIDGHEAALGDSHQLLEKLLMEASVNGSVLSSEQAIASPLQSSVIAQELQASTQSQITSSAEHASALSLPSLTEATQSTTASLTETPNFTVALTQPEEQALSVALGQGTNSDVPVDAMGLSDAQGLVVLLTMASVPETESNEGGKETNAMPLLLLRPRLDTPIPSATSSSAAPSLPPTPSRTPAPALKVPIAPEKSRPRPPRTSRSRPPPPPPPLRPAKSLTGNSPASRHPTSQTSANDTSSSAIKAKPRSFVCEECGKVFTKSNNYKQHMGMHFVEQMRHACGVCGRMFAWKSTLNKHMVRAHCGGPATRVRCARCGREYASATQVAEHERRDHLQLRPHACPTPGCGRRFFKKHDLKVHQRMHSQDKPYICGSCGKAFSHLSHIIRHERIHSGHRPYSCNECGRQFNQSSSLKNHKKTHQEKKSRQESQKDLEDLQQLQQEEQDKRDAAVAFANPLEDPQMETRHLEVPQLEASELEVASLEPLHMHLECDALQVSKEETALLPTPPLNTGTPQEPLVELTVSDTDMVLGLPPSIFPQGLFPDDT